MQLIYRKLILVETALRRQRAARSSILEARLTQYSFRVLLVIIELSVVTIAAVPLRRILSSAVCWTLVHVLVARLRATSILTFIFGIIAVSLVLLNHKHCTGGGGGGGSHAHAH